MPSKRLNMHIKIPRGIIKSFEELGKAMITDLNCSAAEFVVGDGADEEKTNNWYMKYLIAFVGSFAVIETSCICLGWWFIARNHVHEELGNLGYMVLAMGFIHFTCAKLKKPTRNLKQEKRKGREASRQNTKEFLMMKE